MSSKEVIVWVSLGEENIRVGKLWFHLKGRKQSSSFEYDRKWLNHPERFALDPALKLTEGSFHKGFGIFGGFGDSAPDRWGRILMRRFEALNAKEQNRQPATLSEIDYLLGVNDEARQGALRFSTEPNETIFLSPKSTLSIPPIVDLPKLLSATERLMADDDCADDIRLLLAPGSSLGGARPKASIRDLDGSLAIAKFPRDDDEFNTVVWEAVTLYLAKNAGIKVPQHRLENILGKPVLVIKRFDRKDGKRIPFLSSMSMLGAHDNEPHSYLEIAYALAQNGSSPEEDMKELWRRIVFTIMVSNVDDHLRNHGFIYQRYRGWRLSPAYDINPTPLEVAPHILSTSIDFTDNSASLETAMRVAKEFRLTKQEALLIIQEVSVSVNQWRLAALKFGISKQECERMASAFVCQKIK